MNGIYTITTCETIKNGHLGWPEFGITRTIGWYQDFNTADLCVRENWGDIWETCYNYAIIEYVEEGLYPITQRWYYQWDSKNWRYIPIEEPKCMKHITNISIG